jgi:hypothetical protein
MKSPDVLYDETAVAQLLINEAIEEVEREKEAKYQERMSYYKPWAGIFDPKPSVQK